MDPDYTGSVHTDSVLDFRIGFVLDYTGSRIGFVLGCIGSRTGSGLGYTDFVRMDPVRSYFDLGCIDFVLDCIDFVRTGSDLRNYPDFGTRLLLLSLEYC